MTYDELTARAERVLIVATGPSVEALDPKKYKKAARSAYVLAVNGAIDWVPVAHGWFSLDLSEPNRARINNRRKEVEYIAAVPDGYGTPQAKNFYHRTPPRRPFTRLRRIAAEGLSSDPSVIHSGNSAWGALQVACLMGAKRIALLGVDATAEHYAFCEGDHATSTFGHLPMLFEMARPQLYEWGVEVVNGSPESRVWCFPRMKPEAAIDWLTR